MQRSIYILAILSMVFIGVGPVFLVLMKIDPNVSLMLGTLTASLMIVMMIVDLHKN